jgi:hypothetical protein
VTGGNAAAVRVAAFVYDAAVPSASSSNDESSFSEGEGEIATVIGDPLPIPD